MKSVTHGRVKHFVNEQFFYIQFRIRPKDEVRALSVGNAQEIALEVPRKLVEDWKEENPYQNVTDKSIATDIARVVAIETAFPGANRSECESDVLNWREQRSPVMNARACDHHDNGIRAWLIRYSDAEVPAE
jgi:hypothetical protein